MSVVHLPFGGVPAAQAVVNLMVFNGADKHTVLKDLRLNVFHGGHVWVLYEAEQPVSFNCTKFGKRKGNVWEPYANWYSAYTVPWERRKGHATVLYRIVEGLAAAAGCRRIKSLAGSRAGLALHHSLRHACWGLTPNNEVWVDSPLPGYEAMYIDKGAPPQVLGELMSNSEIKAFIKKGLRYDTQA